MIELIQSYLDQNMVSGQKSYDSFLHLFKEMSKTNVSLKGKSTVLELDIIIAYVILAILS